MASKGEEIKLKIIVAAIKCFYEKGFEEATFSQIAKMASISQPLIYNYFKDKMDLLYSAALISAEAGRQYIDSKIDPRQPAIKRLHSYIEGNLDWFSHNRASGFSISSIYHFAHTHEEIRKLYELITQTGFERIEILLHQIQNEQGTKIPQIPMKARLLHNIIVGEVYKNNLAKKTNIRQELFSMIDSFLGI